MYQFNIYTAKEQPEPYLIETDHHQEQTTATFRLQHVLKWVSDQNNRPSLTISVNRE